MEIYIGVGSNIEAENNILSALNILQNRGIRLCRISTYYRTEALRHKENPYYINGILTISTDVKTYEDLDRILKETEKKCGRIRRDDKWVSRTIDLDILLMKDYISEDIMERDFIYIPLLELEPELELPGYGRLIDLVDPDRKKNMNPLSVFTENLRSMINE
jgi:2-amino-4-hydroxy-6-hydroxymethyldihydropteridine diphosphokinase